MRPIAAIALALFSVVALGGKANAGEWNLAPITAHAPNVWAGAPNWTYDGGNPLADHGAKWTLSAQRAKDPDLTSAYEPLVKATAWNYFYVWALGADQEHAYRDFILSTKGADNTPQAGPSTAIRFRPPSAGTYQVDIVATAKVQNQTAGHARATVYILSADASSASQLASVDLNNPTPDAFGHFPDKLNYHAAVPLKKDEELAVRVQTINPGPASAGVSSLTFTQFKITGP
ncbi:MAG: hypothetical protein P4L33_00540 [Capsulimonadaceae bacterium]|nr:hypothetical protein [Capsulimonadaceae bacterium]